MEAEAGACEDKKRIATLAKKLNLDAIHDTVHEMCKDEARHGKGFEALMRADVLYNRGDLDGAEILCQKAIYMADSRNQYAIYIAAYYSISSDSGSPGELYRSAPPGICWGFFEFFTD